MDKASEQDYYSSTGKSVYRVGHDSIRLMKRMEYFYKQFANINYFEIIASVFSRLNEISELFI